MLKITTQRNGNVLVATLDGNADHDAGFAEQINTEGIKTLQITCRNVDLITSLGAKVWIQYFGSIKKQGIAVEFYQCSYAVIEQINLIKSFRLSGKVISMLVPYACSRCHHEFSELQTTDALRSLHFQTPKRTCPKCHTSEGAVFDDIEEEFFGFMNLPAP